MPVSSWIESLARPEIVAMKPYSSARTEAPAEGVLLNANEMPDSLLDPEDEIRADLDINRYPEPQPAALINRFAEIYGVGVDKLLVTRGSDEGIDLLVRVFCRAGRDAVLECPPGFGMYRIAARTQDAKVVRALRCAEDGFAFNLNNVLAALQADQTIKLLFLTSPNNPSGDLIDTDGLTRVLQNATGRALVVVDEAYVEFCPGHSAISLLAQFEHLVILRTLSKAWAAAGLRCGTVIAAPQIIGLLRRIIAPYPLAGPVIKQVYALLAPDRMQRQQAMVQQIVNNKKRLVAFLRRLPYLQNLWPGEANFVLIRVAGSGDGQRDAADELLRHCARGGIILRGFSSEPLLHNCLRITVGSAEEIVRLKDLMMDWTGGGS